MNESSSLDISAIRVGKITFLANAHLPGTDLAGAQLPEADFYQANLIGVSFAGANNPFYLIRKSARSYLLLNQYYTVVWSITIYNYNGADPNLLFVVSP